MIIDYPDGTLTIRATDVCAYEVTFANRFASGPGDLFAVDGWVYVEVIKGDAVDPETLIVRNLKTGAGVVLVIRENETGSVCIPWPVLS